MTRTATGSIVLQASVGLRNTLNDGSQADAQIGGKILRSTLESGISDSQINRSWQRTGIVIAAGNFRDFDLVEMSNNDIGAGTGNDALGQPLDIEEMVLLVVRNSPSSAGRLEIQGTAPGAAPISWIPAGFAKESLGGALGPGGIRAWFEPGEPGLDVALSANVLRLSASGGDVEAEIYVWGRSDDDDSSSSSGTDSSSSISSQSSTSESSSSV